MPAQESRTHPRVMELDLPAPAQRTAATTRPKQDRLPGSREHRARRHLGGCAGLCTEEGLSASYRAYRARLSNRARLVVVDPDLAEEAVQETFLRAWRSCASFDPSNGPLLNWLLVIVRNVAIDLVKARTRRPPVAPGPARDSEELPVPGISHVDRLLLRDQLRHALGSLSSEQRAAVVETILRDRSYADVAADFDVPPGTMRTRVHYALRRLRVVLEEAEQAA